jgi:hypothetical protein
MMTLDDWLAKRPVDREAVEKHKARMRAELRAHALRELREASVVSFGSRPSLVTIESTSPDPGVDRRRRCRHATSAIA